MQQSPFYLRILAAGLFSAGCGAAHAQSFDEPVPKAAASPQWGLGLGVGAERSPYRDFGNKTDVLPLFFYNSDRFHVFGTSADWKMLTVDQFDFTLRVKYANDGYKSGDASVLNGMDERKGGIWLGATTTWRSPVAQLSLEWLTATGSAKGQTLKLGVERGFKFGRIKLTPHAEAAWMSNDFVDYYYGVKDSEANAARPAYTGKSTTNLSLGLRADYALTPNQSVIVDVGAKHYGNGITDSPLVNRSTSPSVRLGYLYNF